MSLVFEICIFFRPMSYNISYCAIIQKLKVDKDPKNIFPLTLSLLWQTSAMRKEFRAVPIGSKISWTEGTGEKIAEDKVGYWKTGGFTEEWREVALTENVVVEVLDGDE